MTRRIPSHHLFLHNFCLLYITFFNFFFFFYYSYFSLCEESLNKPQVRLAYYSMPLSTVLQARWLQSYMHYIFLQKKKNKKFKKWRKGVKTMIKSIDNRSASIYFSKRDKKKHTKQVQYYMHNLLNHH